MVNGHALSESDQHIKRYIVYHLPQRKGEPPASNILLPPLPLLCLLLNYGIFDWVHAIDMFLVDSPATNLALSPTGDFLASSHVDGLGIYLWSNKTLYSHVSLRPFPINHTPSLSELPTTALIDTENEERRAGGFVIDTKGSESQQISEMLTDDSPMENLTPLSEGLVTLSSLPKSRWSNLQNLDIIKLRNKPVEPPKQPKQAPFFLPTLPGLEPKFIPAADDEDIPSTESGGSRIVNLGKLQPLSEFQKCLEECASTKKCESLSFLLFSLSLSHLAPLPSLTTFKANDDELVIPVLVHIMCGQQNY